MPDYLREHQTETRSWWIRTIIIPFRGPHSSFTRMRLLAFSVTLWALLFAFYGRSICSSEKASAFPEVTEPVSYRAEMQTKRAQPLGTALSAALPAVIQALWWVWFFCECRVSLLHVLLFGDVEDELVALAQKHPHCGCPIYLAVNAGEPASEPLPEPVSLPENTWVFWRSLIKNWFYLFSPSLSCEHIEKEGRGITEEEPQIHIYDWCQIWKPTGCEDSTKGSRTWAQLQAVLSETGICGTHWGKFTGSGCRTSSFQQESHPMSKEGGAKPDGAIFLPRCISPSYNLHTRLSPFPGSLATRRIEMKPEPALTTFPPF